MRLATFFASVLTATALVSARDDSHHPAKHLSKARTSPPKGATVVRKGGGRGTYPTVQDGVNALSVNETGEQYLFIYPGVYTEQVYIAPRIANLTVYGYTEDMTTYKQNTVNITYNLALINATHDDLTATVRNWAINSKMYNINILNTFGHINTNGQNLALSAQKTNQGYYGMGLYGYQDTLLANAGLQLYAKSLILGAIDFIFGQTALAWLDQIETVTIAAGCVTASGRDSATNPSWYVINNSSVRGVNASLEPGINYLGRPWRNFSRVTFQSTYLSDVINPAGCSPWQATSPQTSNVTYQEFENYGPGSFPTEGPRANFSEHIADPIPITQILGKDYLAEWWVDSSYL